MGSKCSLRRLEKLDGLGLSHTFLQCLVDTTVLYDLPVQLF